MRVKPLIVPGLVSVSLSLGSSMVSYFLRSDGFGMPGIQDGIIRVGCPFLMVEVGGFSHREHLSLSAALGNLLVAVLTVTTALAFWRLTRRLRGHTSVVSLK